MNILYKTGRNNKDIRVTVNAYWEAINQVKVVSAFPYNIQINKDVLRFSYWFDYKYVIVGE